MTVLERNSGLIAIVERASIKPNSSTPTQSDYVAIQVLSLKVVSNDGGFMVISETSTSGPALVEGDIVIWLPMENLGMFDHVDPRSSWIGLTIAKVACQIDMNIDGFTIDHHYR